MLGGFAFARHGTSLLTALREVEFLAKVFFSRRCSDGFHPRFVENLQCEKAVFDSALLEGVTTRRSAAVEERGSQRHAFLACGALQRSPDSVVEVYVIAIEVSWWSCADTFIPPADPVP